MSQQMLTIDPLNVKEVNEDGEEENIMNEGDENEEFMEEIQKDFQNVVSNLKNLKMNITVLQNQMRTLDKNISRKLRYFNKKMKKMRRKGNRKPSGFAVPTKITEELSTFMGKDKDELVARTEVTKSIIKYIKDNQLEWEENKKFIDPDKTLKKLLRINENSERLTYFNLQRFVNIHFIKKPKMILVPENTIIKESNETSLSTE